MIIFEIQKLYFDRQVQQELAKPGQLERFLGDKTQV